MQERETYNNHNVYSLSEVAMSIHKVIERTYNRPYYIKAEILKLNYYPYSGHCYPELVEREGNTIKTEMRAIIWSANFQDINRRFVQITGEPLKENIRILCLATVQFSPKHGLALHIENIEPSYTLGEMVRNRQEVIDRLKKEQVFDLNRQLPMPLLPKRVAVISVETSKGYSDFMQTLHGNEHGYKFHTELFPSILQGDKAITGITGQLQRIELRKDDFDVVVIVRGGGGDVGMSCYDDYDLTHRVATFPLPVLTGIGHSTNLTVTDMVAYARFITPTDVAFSLLEAFRRFDEGLGETMGRIVQSAQLRLSEVRQSLVHTQTVLQYQLPKVLDSHRNRLGEVAKNLVFKSKEMTMNQLFRLRSLAQDMSRGVELRMDRERQQIARLGEVLPKGCRGTLQRRQRECDAVDGKLKLLSPDNVLKRGYSITLKDGKAVTAAADLRPGDRIVTRFHEGEVTSTVDVGTR
ncbi:MAG: exodeoxyribonuclease VII large subunit [Bacteroidales bacterium]|nr:exodeoxyribonuclease VII large subunit [Bacteroidales bacterium]